MEGPRPPPTSPRTATANTRPGRGVGPWAEGRGRGYPKPQTAAGPKRRPGGVSKELTDPRRRPALDSTRVGVVYLASCAWPIFGVIAARL